MGSFLILLVGRNFKRLGFQPISLELPNTNLKFPEDWKKLFAEAIFTGILWLYPLTPDPSPEASGEGYK
jgi:hypothetical protein